MDKSKRIPETKESESNFRNIDIMPDSSEVVPYPVVGIPLFIDRGLISSYSGRKALCHWHDDVEFISVINGNMNYFVEGQSVFLDTGDILYINSRRMHYRSYSDKIITPSMVCQYKKIYTLE